MFGASGVRIADVLDFCSTLCPDDETGLFFFLDCYDFAVHVCGLIGLLDNFACEGVLLILKYSTTTERFQ